VRQWVAEPPGRSAECAEIGQLLGAVRDGHSGVLVLVGEAGIGKTRLLQYAEGAAADLRVVAIAGAQSESRLGYAGLHHLLRPFLDRLDELPVPQRDALGTAFGLFAGPPADRFLVSLAGLTLLALAAADQALLCLVDDAHWLDRESLEALAFIARRVQVDRIGLLVSIRDQEPVPARALADLPQRAVSGLDDASARELLVTGSGQLDEQVLSRVVTETGGNPLALLALREELSLEQLAGREPLPGLLPVGRELEEYFLRQIAALPPATQRLLLLTCLAPVDDPGLLWRAQSAQGLHIDDAEPAVAAGILVQDGTGLVFRHPLVRSAVYSGARLSERREAHLTLADVSDRERDPDRRAWHLSSAVVDPDDTVADELEQSADRARLRGGYAAQALFLRRSAELTAAAAQRCERFLSAAQAHLLAGDHAMAGSALREAQSLLPQPRAHARAQQLQAATDLAGLELSRVLAALLILTEQLGDQDVSAKRGILADAMAVAMLARSDQADSQPLDVARIALATPGDADGPATVADLLLDGFATRIAAGYEAAVPLLQAAVAAMETHEESEVVHTLVVIQSARASDEILDDPRRRSAMHRIARFQRAHGALDALSITLQALATCELRAGRLANAHQYLIEADGIDAVLNAPHRTLSVYIELYAWRGQGDQVTTVSALLRSLLGPVADATVTHSMLLIAHTVLELGRGNFAAAYPLALEVFDADAPGHSTRVITDLIEAAVRTDHPEVAEQALERLTARAAAAGTPWARGLLARGRALVAADPEQHYLDSIDHLTQAPNVTDLARSQLLYGEWLRRHRRRSDAREPLRAAHAFFTAMGAPLFAERARAELQAAGDRAPDPAWSAARGTLTPQEAQIATLAAEGHTNTEIAARLYITTSTVEYHLNKVFRKLDITTRRHLARTLENPHTTPGIAD
jgi:DNA-binding CsgD family transcriptional regulator